MPAPDALAPPPPARRAGLAGRALVLTAALGPTLAALGLLAVGAPAGLLARALRNDAAEPNDRLDQATPLALGAPREGLRLDAADVDWFRVEVPAGKALVVEAGVVQPSRGETSIHRATGVRVASSRGAPLGAPERAVWWPGLGAPAEAVLVRLVGAREAFSLRAEAVDPATRYEPNDDAGAAAVLDAGAPARGIRGSGEDWFRVAVPAHRGLRVRLAGADPGLSLSWGRPTPRAGAGAPGASGAGGEASVAPVVTELVAPSVGAARAVLVRVAGAGRYDLELDLGPAGAPRAAQGARRPPPVVTPARLEPNDVKEQATPVRPGRYVDLRGNGEDWFVVDVPPDATLTTTLAFSHRAGDIDLELSAADGRQLGVSCGTEDVEVATARLPEGGPVYLHVYGGRSNPYTMTLELASGEPGEVLEPGRYLDLLCSGNDVWAVRLDAGQALDATTSWSAAEGHLELAVLDPTWASAGASVEQTWGDPRTAHATLSAATARTVLLRVSGAQVPYTLDLEVLAAATTPGVAGPPGAPRPIRPGTHRGLPLTDEAVWTIDVARGQRLSVDLQFRNVQGDIELELQGADGTPVAASTSSSDRESAAFQSPIDQTMRIRVYCYGRSTRYAMTVALDAGGRRTVEPGTLTQQTCVGRSVYQVSVPAGKRLVATLAFVTAQGDLDLELRDAQNVVLARSESTEDRERVEHVAAGDETLTLVVYNAQNTFDLTVALEDP